MSLKCLREVSTTDPTTSDNHASGYIDQLSEVYSLRTRRRWKFLGESSSGVGSWEYPEGPYYELVSPQAGDTITGVTVSTAFASGPTLYANLVPTQRVGSVFRMRCGGTYSKTGSTGDQVLTLAWTNSDISDSVTVNNDFISDSGEWRIDYIYEHRTASQMYGAGLLRMGTHTEGFQNSGDTWDSALDSVLSLSVNPNLSGDSFSLEHFAMDSTNYHQYGPFN